MSEWAAHGWPEEAFVQVGGEVLGRAIRTRRWMYSVVAPGLNGCDPTWSDTYVEDCLYDVVPHFLAYLAAPAQSIATTGSLPTTQASCPDGRDVTSPGPASNSVPSFMRMRSRPET
jgi:hypothetical protein